MRSIFFATAVPHVFASTCCWSKWGDSSSCGNYPAGGSGGLCGHDFGTQCFGDDNCSPSPSPVPSPVLPPSTQLPLTGNINIIGYYGNSGNAVHAIPHIVDVHPNYNVIIFTFASINHKGHFSLELQGPYEKHHTQLAKDIRAWKKKKDPFGRRKLALVSIGGQNGRWPSVSASSIEAGLHAFMQAFSFDGLDVDLEGGAVHAAASLVPVIKSLTSKGKVVTAAPEAAQGPLTAYKDMLKHLTWVHPQFYNNGPNAVAHPFLPSASRWPKPWTVKDWQDESNNESFWAGVLGAIGVAGNVPKHAQGMLVPATAAAAGNNNHWNIHKLAHQVRQAGVKHVGTWAIAYDKTQDWKFAKALGSLCSSTIDATTIV